MSTSSPESPEPDDLDRQWADITARLGPLADPGAPGPRDYAPQEDDEGHFTPPDPGPVLPREPRNVLPWTGAVGGPMSLLVLLVFWPGAPPWAYFVGVVATVAGLITIWWRLPHRRDEGGGPTAPWSELARVKVCTVERDCHRSQHGPQHQPATR